MTMIKQVKIMLVILGMLVMVVVASSDLTNTQEESENMQQQEPSQQVSIVPQIGEQNELTKKLDKWGKKVDELTKKDEYSLSAIQEGEQAASGSGLRVERPMSHREQYEEMKKRGAKMPRMIGDETLDPHTNVDIHEKRMNLNEISPDEHVRKSLLEPELEPMLRHKMSSEKEWMEDQDYEKEK